MFKKIAKFAAFLLASTMVLAVAACGGGKDGIPNGKYESDGSGSFDYLDFKSGGKVEVSVMFSSETVKYTYKNGVLAFNIGGMPYDMPCSVSGNVLTAGGSKYYKGGAPVSNSAQSRQESQTDTAANVPGADVADEPAAATTEFDGEYEATGVVSNFKLVVSNGEATLDANRGKNSTATLNPDGSFDISVYGIMSTYHFFHKHESYYYTIDGDSLSRVTDLTKVGGKSLFEYAIEEQTANLPAITLSHEYDDAPALYLGSEGDAIEIVDGVLYIEQNGRRPFSEDPVLNTAQRLFWSGTVWGSKTFFFVDGNSSLWGVGENTVGQLGDGSGVDKSTPVKILDNVVDVKTNDIAHVIYAFKADGTVWRWGNINNEKVYAPELLAEDVAEMYPWAHGVTFIKTNGDLVFQRSGLDQKTNEPFQPVTLLHKVKKFCPEYAGGNSALSGAFVVLSDDALYHYPNLFTDPNITYWVPNKNMPVTAADNEKLFDNADIAALKFHKDDRVQYLGRDDPWIVLTNDGILYGKGKNTDGQLGDGTKVDRDDWVKIADGVKSYGVTGEYSDKVYHYIKLDGTRWEWTPADPSPKEIESPVEETPTEEALAEEPPSEETPETP